MTKLEAVEAQQRFAEVLALVGWAEKARLYVLYLNENCYMRINE